MLHFFMRKDSFRFWTHSTLAVAKVVEYITSWYPSIFPLIRNLRNLIEFAKLTVNFAQKNCVLMLEIGWTMRKASYFVTEIQSFNFYFEFWKNLQSILQIIIQECSQIPCLCLYWSKCSHLVLVICGVKIRKPLLRLFQLLSSSIPVGIGSAFSPSLSLNLSKIYLQRSFSSAALNSWRFWELRQDSFLRLNI